MTKLLNARILVALAMIVFVGAVAASATGAFFSDTETSTGNTFAAGEIDLTIDNTSYVTSTSTGLLVASPANSWTLQDLDANCLTNASTSPCLFFSFTDLKPGDVGEDTISVHAGSNNAWACMAANMTDTPENVINEAEEEAGDVTDGPNGGELQNFLNFTFWNDDGDNVFETGETVIAPLTGPASTIFNGTWLPLADSSTGTSSAIVGGTTRFIGKAWCFGTLTPNPVAQGASTSPLVRGTGFTCDGSGDNNVAQTDGISVDVSFQAVQTRNNSGFLCSQLPPLGGAAPTVQTLTVTKIVVATSTGQVVDASPPAASAFTLQIDGFTVTSGAASSTSAGAHVVSELAGGDPDYTGVIGGDCDGAGNVNVPASGAANCTITNTFDGTQTLQ